MDYLYFVYTYIYQENHQKIYIPDTTNHTITIIRQIIRKLVTETTGSGLFFDHTNNQVFIVYLINCL